MVDELSAGFNDDALGESGECDGLLVSRVLSDCLDIASAGRYGLSLASIPVVLRRRPAYADL
jgi:hypothetical protein